MGDPVKKPLLTALITAALAGAALGAPAASAATVHTVCEAGCDYSTIQAAVNAASAGDTIQISGALATSGTTTVNKDVTVTGSDDATVTQTGTAITFLMSGAGSSLSNLTITSNAPVAREFIQVGASDVTVSDNVIYGPAQPLPMSSWVGNRGIVTQGSISGFALTGNTIHTLRSGAYLNPNGTGTIADNTLYNTKGDFLIDNANFQFINNRSGDEAQPSEWGFVVFGNTAPDRYPGMAALSTANNFMTAWDQRDGDTFVAPQSAEDCKNDGWKTLSPGFSNQGQCIKFVNTGR